MIGRRLASAALAATLILSATNPAPAEPPGNIKIAVLDIERVRRNAVAVKAIRAQLSGYLDVYRTDTQKEEQEIRTAQEELGRQRQILTPEGYAEERKKLEERLAGAQDRVQRRRQSLERVNNEAMEQVKETLEKIVAELASERQLTLILRKDQLVFTAPTIEITDEVLQRIDVRLPTVQISEPGG